MKKIILILVFYIFFPFHVFAMETVFLNPNFGDIAGYANNSSCITTDLIGTTEGASQSVVNNTMNHFCKELGYDGGTIYNLDTGTPDPDICKTTSNFSSVNPVWKFDTTGTDNFLSINCFIPDNKVGCTQPNALNYSSQATKDDGSCFYTDTTGSGSSTNISISNSSLGINKPIFDLLTVQYIYDLEALIMFFMMFFRFFSRITSVNGPGKNNHHINKI